MGIVSFWISPGFLKIVILTTVFLFFEGKQLFLGALNQTFPGLWKDLTIPLLLERWSLKGIDPSNINHVNTTATRAAVYVLVPDNLKKFSDTHIFIPAFESLSVLEFEDEF